ncbi:Pyridoxine 5'-phosphate synthase [Polystyrenella longa]|uniref:Pyridoxine 5'-phosphate synthase n=1 Tax=Polystyrenella longa TaxID=2528007 RepID=A0A518CTZ6_9PLAN|nr:pyridoxine 5'-phosphate synthase [Polystyrenella longa]QDU82703.1 Pyridoxine 5'-phosphate synthase [Polystyrenella longa]
MPLLGVNIDHVATVRQARRTIEPDPAWAVVLAELGGADGITIHLREDRRHIQDRDVRVVIDVAQVPVNLEMATEQEITQIALQLKPQKVCLVPEKREEVTTEGGLNVVGNLERVQRCADQLIEAGIEVSLFIDPDVRQIEAASNMGVQAVELHTGSYAEAKSPKEIEKELQSLIKAGQVANDLNLLLNMGHGLTYRNVKPVAEIAGVHEFNIGHSIVARSIMVGMEQAVREMKRLVSG